MTTAEALLKETQLAVRRSNEAFRIATEARADAKDAKEGARSVYKALGEIAAELSRLSGGLQAVSTQVGEIQTRIGPPPARGSQPSAHDIAVAVAEEVEERTGRHQVNSERVAGIVKRTGLEMVGRLVLKIVVPVLVAGAIGAAGWLSHDCTAHGATVVHPPK